MMNRDAISWVGLFGGFVITRQGRNGIFRKEICTNLTAVCLFACLLYSRGLASGERLPPEVPMNQDAGCGGWFHGHRLMLTLQLETGDDVVFMLDTGAPITILDDSLAPKLGSPVGDMRANFVGRKDQHAKIYKAPKILLGNVRLPIDYVTCMSLPTKWKKHFKGILGMDFLQDYCVQLDFKAGKVRFLDSAETNAADWGKMYPLTFSKAGAWPGLIHPVIHQVGLLGNNTNLMIDTGCSVDGLVSSKETGEAIGAWLLSLVGCGRFHAGVWDGEKYTHIKVAPVDHVNVVGLRFLARHLVTLDFPNKKLYLKQTSVGPLKPKNKL